MLPRAAVAVHPAAAPHLSVWDETGGVIFSGDAMGVSYRNFDAESGGPMAVPSTPPNQFNPEATRASIEKMRDLKPALAALAHFGEIRFTPDIAALDGGRENAGPVRRRRRGGESPGGPARKKITRRESGKIPQCPPTRPTPPTRPP